MQSVADYVVLSDNPISLQAGGVTNFPFPIPSTASLVSGLPCILSFQVDTGTGVPPAMLTWRVDVNGTPVYKRVNNVREFCAVQEVFPANVLHTGSNSATVKVEGGQGTLVVSDMVVSFQDSVPDELPFIDARKHGVTANARFEDATWIGQDDTNALQNAIKAAISSQRGQTVLLPPGDIKLTSTVTIESTQGIRLVGAGHQTRLVWAGPDATIPMLLIRDVRDSYFGWFQILCSDGGAPKVMPLRYGILQINHAYPPVDITSNSLGNPSVVTTPVPHGLVTGDLIEISGVIGSVPTINGQWTVKELGPLKFSVPVNVATAGTGGSFKRLRSVTPRHNQYDSISMQGTSGGLTYGWVSGGDPNWVIDGLDPAKQIPWVDGNNDFNFFTNVNIQNYVEAAFLIGHPQCYGNTFVNCLADGGPKSKVGLRKRGGHFQWLGGSMAGNAEVDFKIEHGFSIADRIQFCQSEGSARFIDQTNGNIGSLLVEGCRWTAGAIHPDREIVRWVSPDILSIRSCVLGYAQNPPGACKLAWRSNALQGAPGQQGAQRSVFEFRNNILVTTKSAVDPDAPVVLADCFSALPPTDMGGNMVMTDVLHLLAERMPEWFQNLTHNSATPEVGGYRHFNAANSAATSITNFIRGSEGQRLTLRFTNGNTTLVNGGTIRLAGAADFVGSANDLLELVLIGAVWHECNRSVN